MNDNFTYYEKQPQKCSKSELNKFHELVLKGGKVQEIGLEARINNCMVLGFCTYGDTIIAVSSIKKPQKSYVEKIIEFAKLEKEWSELEYEIGYSFTEEMVRRKGISSEIKGRLLNWMANVEGIIFSTTAISSSQKFLTEHGFIQQGYSYDGKNDKGLKYFERKISR